MHRTKAFTLVELLVVMSIVSLLIALLLPSLSASISSARATKCQVNLKGLGLAQNTYANDYNRFPYAGGSDLSASATNPATVLRNVTWDDLLGLFNYDGRSLAWNYVNGVPAQIRYIAGNATYQPGDNTIMKTLYHCPSYVSALDISNSQFFARTYEMNSGGNVDMRNNAGTNEDNYLFLRGVSYNAWSKHVSAIPNPSGTFLMVEGDTPGGCYMGYGGITAMGTPYSQQGGALGVVLPFHGNNDHWNYGFVDGHVALISPFDTYGTGTYGGPSWNGVSTVGRADRGSNGMWTADPHD